MAEKELALKQSDTRGFTLQIKLVENRELQLVKTGKKAEQSYSVDILSLQDKSQSVFSVAWKWLAASAIFFLVMLLLLKILPGYLTDNRNLYLGLILLFGIIGSIFCFIQFWKNTSRQQIFFSLNGHVPIIILSKGKPSKTEFQEFISGLEKRIDAFRKHMNLSDDKLLVGEMKMLRRLSENGVIKTDDYEKAKAKLFSGFDNA